MDPVEVAAVYAAGMMGLELVDELRDLGCLT